MPSLEVSRISNRGDAMVCVHRNRDRPFARLRANGGYEAVSRLHLGFQALTRDLCEIYFQRLGA